jgi:hypothetical protein
LPGLFQGRSDQLLLTVIFKWICENKIKNFGNSP